MYSSSGSFDYLSTAMEAVVEIANGAVDWGQATEEGMTGQPDATAMISRSRRRWKAIEEYIHKKGAPTEVIEWYRRQQIAWQMARMSSSWNANASSASLSSTEDDEDEDSSSHTNNNGVDLKNYRGPLGSNLVCPPFDANLCTINHLLQMSCNTYVEAVTHAKVELSGIDALRQREKITYWQHLLLVLEDDDILRHHAKMSTKLASASARDHHLTCQALADSMTDIHFSAAIEVHQSDSSAVKAVEQSWGCGTSPSTLATVAAAEARQLNNALDGAERQSNPLQKLVQHLLTMTKVVDYN